MEGVVPGFVFSPTDDQIINEYLLKKEQKLPLPGRAVVELDLYAEKSPWDFLNGEGVYLPWQIFRTRDGRTRKIKCEHTIYVLTPLKKASQKAQNRIRRTAGCGKWQEQWARDILNDSDDVIGFKKMLVFMVIDDSVFNRADEGLGKGHWIMHEYTLKKESFAFALCKITRDDSKNLKRAPKKARKRKAAVDEEEVNNSKRKGNKIGTIAEENDDKQRDHHESNSTLPSQFPPGVEQSTTVNQFCNCRNDLNFDFVTNEILGCEKCEISKSMEDVEEEESPFVGIHSPQRKENQIRAIAEKDEDNHRDRHDCNFTFTVPYPDTGEGATKRL